MSIRADSSWADDVVVATLGALEPLRDPVRAQGMRAYMKDIAPFLGVSAPERRRTLRIAWAQLPAPTSDQLGDAGQALMDLDEREFHYAAYDLIERWREKADASFLSDFGESLLTTTPWWDTVDGLANVAVSPLCKRYPSASLIDRWSESGDRWLIRAALGHQRGWKADTDVHRMLALCDRHWGNAEFFVAKAIGWALRDLARMDPMAIRIFLDQHEIANRVARREAERGLARA